MECAGLDGALDLKRILITLIRRDATRSMALPGRTSDLLLRILSTQKLTDLLLDVKLLEEFISRVNTFRFSPRLDVDRHSLTRLEFRPLR